MDKLISWEDFEKVDIRCGQIIDVRINDKAKVPAYVLTIDFGDTLGIKISSAQLTQNYTPEDLMNKKIVAVINFPTKKVAGIKSEVLVLATVCDKLGTMLLSTADTAINGSKVN